MRSWYVTPWYRRLQFPDWLVITGAALNTIARFLTNVYISINTSAAQTVATAHEVAMAVEANKFVIPLLTLTGYAHIMQYFIVPALMLGGYVWARRKWGIERGGILELYSAVLFFASLSDTLNDVAIVLPRIILGG